MTLNDTTEIFDSSPASLSSLREVFERFLKVDIGSIVEELGGGFSQKTSHSRSLINLGNRNLRLAENILKHWTTKHP